MSVVGDVQESTSALFVESPMSTQDAVQSQSAAVSTTSTVCPVCR